MSVQSEITRLADAKAAIKTAIEGKGVTVPDATMLDGMAALIDTIEAGGGGGGSDTSIEDGLVTRTLTSYTNSRVTSIGAYAFAYNLSLRVVDFSRVTSIAIGAFQSCRELRTLVIRNTSAVCTLAAPVTSIFPSMNGSGNIVYHNIASAYGRIYVPDDLVSKYKSATNWSAYATKIKPLSQYTGDDASIETGTSTGGGGSDI